MKKYIKLSLVGILSVSLLVACGKKNQDESTADTADKIAPSSKTFTKNSQTEKPTVGYPGIEAHKLGETASTANATYTLKSVELTKDRDDSLKKQPKYVIRVKYTMGLTDNSFGEGSRDMAVDAFDSQGNRLMRYPDEDEASVKENEDPSNMDYEVEFASDKLGDITFDITEVLSSATPVKFKVTLK